jgi:hypothetical protein
MKERMIALSKAAAVVLEGGGWHRRITESRVTFDVGRFSLIHIAPCGRESVVETLARNFRIVGRRRRLGIYRSWMRTSSERKW